MSVVPGELTARRTDRRTVFSFIYIDRYWLKGFPHMVIFKKETNKYKKKILVILQSIGIIVTKSKKITYLKYHH